MVLQYNKVDIVTGIAFGVLCIPSSLAMGLFVILPYIAPMMIFKESSTKIYLFKNNKKNTFLITLILIFVIGGILAGINTLLAMSSISINVSFKIKWILDALCAGVFEEIFFRLFFFAICVYLVKNQELSKLQNILCYVIMVVPHVLIHFNLQTFNVSNMIVLSVLFGMPFALMQRKANLVSAIGAHAFVDFMRFCLLGV
ncbi:CAAX protease self-immunity [Clostridium collagenovorans DSM 3089]|uniref:CAAX protease self-immunity n=1 Tax=Clostridium collagenovorans DSM 3089 TaxID=1121306 RepID=A0A1M5S3V6_9CLOT|nr:CPBP family glutamic-type intramembrane protease [Clostridium collagenovorans]SHH33171.1 CAAX protease self-immunity [Clostridium collagenovorans DSM 3089]